MWLPSLKSVTPIGGGFSLALKRDTDPAILKQIADAWMKSVNPKEFQAFDAKKPRFPDPVVGEEADRRAALWDCVASNLLVDAGPQQEGPQRARHPQHRRVRQVVAAERVQAGDLKMAQHDMAQEARATRG